MASERLSSAVFVEVKTTKWAANNVFELSLPELHFACKEGVRFDIYRVFLPPEAWQAHRLGRRLRSPIFADALSARALHHALFRLGC